MKILLTFFIQFVTIFAFAAPGDTTRIRVHDAVDMVWYENYDRPVTFPNDNVTYSKILMHYTMGCASTGCSDWDYTTKIELRKPLGYMDSTVSEIIVISEEPYDADTIWNVFEAKESFELARVITPYGGYMRVGSNGYNSNWKHVHTFDVTDYAPLLKGDMEIRAFYGGWSSGFSVTVDFEFIEGIPPREVLEIRNLWQTGGDGWTYQSYSDFEQNYLHQLPVNIPAEMENAKLRFIPSGHGFDNNTSCAEFCEKHYYLSLDGNQIGSNLMWDSECGSNPIFPQGGTWLYDRANWCPGLRTHHFDHELTGLVSAGATHNFNIDIEQINWAGTQAPVYILETQLFIYGEKNFQYDAAIEDIISPSVKDDYKRFNPICNHAAVKIRNYGAENLTSATIKYSVNGNNWRTYEWQGNLAFEEAEIVTLSLTETWEWVGTAGGESKFLVTIENPNGHPDENALNDGLSSTFNTTPVLPPVLEFQFMTNTKPLETTWTLFDAYGTVLKQNASNLTANTFYRDTFDLDPGCYLLRIEDSGKNGLSWWANNDGSGLARLRIPSGATVHTFVSDFGTSIDYYFTTGYTLNLPGLFQKEEEILVFPNPNEGKFTLSFDWFDNEDVVIEVTNMLGQVIERDVVSVDNYESFVKKYDLSGHGSGNYLIHIITNNKKVIKKVTLF